jgi:glycosyltransferase involved in cell wall biosynthesis
MKLIIAYGSLGKYPHMKEFADALSDLGVECKLIKDTDYSKGFPSKNVRDWINGDKKFHRLVKEFKPDAIFVDRQIHIGLSAVRAKIPLFILVRGHVWSEIKHAHTLYKGSMMKVIIWLRARILEKNFSRSTMIFPICRYLESIVKEHHPLKPTSVFLEGIDSSIWHAVPPMELKHPCVGLLQDANWWGKTKEMKILKEVLKEMPDIQFYWAGDGPYAKEVLSELEKFPNFKWLGRLQYPEKVREFLSSIDIYALVTGMDLAPLTLKQAQLMKKPVIATNVGGNPEMMVDGKTGYLVTEGDPHDLSLKISKLLNDRTSSTRMGEEGYLFIKKNFDWSIIARNFVNTIKPYISKKQ